MKKKRWRQGILSVYNIACHEIEIFPLYPIVKKYWWRVVVVIRTDKLAIMQDVVT